MQSIQEGKVSKDFISTVCKTAESLDLDVEKADGGKECTASRKAK